MDNSYTDAMQTIVSYDHDQLTDALKIITDVKTAYDSGMTNLQAIVAAYAAMNATGLGAGQDIANAATQLGMIEYTMTNVASLVSQSLALRSAPPSPTTTS